jgi:hypothetical protein
LAVGLPVMCHLGIAEATAEDSPATLIGRAQGRMLANTLREIVGKPQADTRTIHDVPHAGPTRRAVLTTERNESGLLSRE